MPVLLGAIKSKVKSYKVGDIFKGAIDGTWKNSALLFKPNKSYLIDRKTLKVIKTFKTPYDLIKYQNENELFNTFSHWTNKI